MKISEVKDFLETINSIDEYNMLSLHFDERIGVQKLLKQKLNSLQKEADLINKYNEMNKYEDCIDANYIAGIDEVGRGPLAGEVVAAAVILNDKIIGLNDSKKLSEKKRNALYQIIIDTCNYGIGIATVDEIDSVNIYEATKLAMKRAVLALKLKPDHLLVDAMKLDIGIPETKVIKGDSVSNSIAAASIVAKVHRDKLMKDYSEMYPGYDFVNNKGYGTKEHLKGIEQYGVTEIHRKTFQPIKDMLLKT
ncbi:ribonuclease HII [Phocicoccus pinnipedialis]|uniref:Ribonuclease HII n=1 Tax=Phocicoccus pinnipedialis TaxID=110845 RepID=A0A6V7RGU0_9BACL|nr:ribonuclease HII [Jeotgalicoccus pinnipedialis]MBP1939100.1 ribonuclease HII [Jeotgalicoccus pinnipedialis]CAD2076812.1 Ribonuclease HII [Jeotgalicoccus pinnipedialis]